MRGQDAVNTDHRLSSTHGSFQTSKCLHFISSPHKPFILATDGLLWILSGFWLVNILHARLWLDDSCGCSLSRSASPSSGVTASSISLITDATPEQLFWIWINNHQSCNTGEILYHKGCVRACLSVSSFSDRKASWNSMEGFNKTKQSRTIVRDWDNGRASSCFLSRYWCVYVFVMYDWSSLIVNGSNWQVNC